MPPKPKGETLRKFGEKQDFKKTPEPGPKVPRRAGNILPKETRGPTSSFSMTTLEPWRDLITRHDDKVDCAGEGIPSVN